MPAPTASRINDERGTREVFAFVGDGEQIFTCLDRPLAEPKAGVLIFSSVLADIETNYRREVLLAREFAARGIVGMRFHYPGTGHSGGEALDQDLTGFLDGAHSALASLRGVVGDRPIGVVGTRLGAIVAAAVARDLPRAPLALWEPTVEARSYFRDQLRQRALSRMVGGGAQTDAGDELVAGARVDVLGYGLGGTLAASFAGRGLESEIGTDPRSVLILDVGPVSHPRREYVKLADRLREAGHAVELLKIGQSELWRFVGETWEPEDRRPVTRDLLRTTVEWLEGALGRRVGG